MKKIYFALFMTALFSCKEKSNQHLQFDDQGIILNDSITIAPHDAYYQSQEKPTRGTSATVAIANNNDTAKVFIVKIIEVVP